MHRNIYRVEWFGVHKYIESTYGPLGAVSRFIDKYVPTAEQERIKNNVFTLKDFTGFEVENVTDKVE